METKKIKRNGMDRGNGRAASSIAQQREFTKILKVPDCVQEARVPYPNIQVYGVHIRDRKQVVGTHVFGHFSEKT